MGAPVERRCNGVALNDKSDDVGPWGRESEFWEHQGERLTVGRLRIALTNADDILPLIVVIHDGCPPYGADPHAAWTEWFGYRPRAVALTVSEPL